jgi:cyclic pyranopterin phosphate synthase
MKGVNEDEFDAMIGWCGEHGFDLCLIETMPMGEISEDRTDQYLPLSVVRARLRKTWTLEDTDYRTGGPARYFDIKETGRRIGFITPMTHNFCESCNRVRLTCTGTLYMCLGQDDSAEFRRCCARVRRTRSSTRRSARRSPASRRAMISSSTAGMTRPAVAGT